MKCVHCGNELTDDMFVGGICFSCGNGISDSIEQANKERAVQERKNKEMAIEVEKEKAKLQAELVAEEEERFTNHMVTTGFTFEGFPIKKYLGLVSGEVVMGTGYFSDFAASLSDFLGVEATEYSAKIKRAKKVALGGMIKESVLKGGNAIIGISYEYMTFSGNMIGVSVNGTSVITEKMNFGGIHE